MKRITLSIIAAFVFFTMFAQMKPARTAVNTVNVPTPVVPMVYDSTKKPVRGELIKTIKVWKGGQSIDAEAIDCAIVYDGLDDSTATVYYMLKDSSGAQVADGNLTIGKGEYRQFNTAPNRINWVYNFVIRALRLQQRQTLN